MKISLVLLCLALSASVVAQTPAASKQSSATGKKPLTVTKKAAAAAKKQVAATKPHDEISTLKDQREKASYAVGFSMGNSLRTQYVDVDPDIVAKGLHDGFAGGKALMTEDEAKAAMSQLQKEVREQQEARMAKLGEKNKAEGAAFLEANKSKPGVVTLPSGLQYKILKEGTGPKPTTTDTVVCNYRGTLINGKEFDSSYKHGKPASFPVNRVIKGWTEALQLMPVGSKWELFIPSELGYGERGAGEDLGPNSTLIFEVELLSIEGK